MTEKELLEEGFSIVEPPFVRPPFIWPESRVHAGVADYIEKPPWRQLFIDADLISGLLVGVDDETIKWLDDLLRSASKIRIYLVLVLFPAGPTRAEHLRAIDILRASYKGTEKTLEIRLLPIDEHFERDFKRMNLPPTVIQSHNGKTGRTVMTIGSVGDAGHDSFSVGSLNFVFQPDDAMRDVWRRWFQYCFSSAAPLTGDTLQIPHLIPTKGDPEAAQLWLEFQKACRALKSTDQSGPTVDPKTGEILTDKNGKKVVAWDEGITALDPLAQFLQQVYARGWLVTVDETTRIKPLAIPVKATLLGQQSERTLGALTQKQSFSLQVLDEMVGKEVEKCRRVNDIVDLLTYLLSMGSHWLPEGAKVLFEKELEARNEKGLASLKAALGGDDVPQFVAKRKGKIKEDLDAMYNQLGQGKSVPADKLAAVFTEVQNRLTAALSARITPRAVYNKIAPPDLTSQAPDESWTQPLSLLLRSARLMRESMIDAYFPRRLSGLSITDQEFLAAMDVFGDVILKSPDSRSAKAEMEELAKIEASDAKPKEKCVAVWKVISALPISRIEPQQ